MRIERRNDIAANSAAQQDQELHTDDQDHSESADNREDVLAVCREADSGAKRETQEPVLRQNRSLFQEEDHQKGT